MEAKVNIPFRLMLELVRRLNPKQKAMLKAELEVASVPSNSGAPDFLKVIASGPVYAADDIAQINENRKSIEQWRTIP